MAKQDFFNSDNPFNVMLTRIFNLLELNLLWILFSLPIITIGASTASLYAVCFRMLSDREAGIFREFVKNFRQNLRQSIPYTLTLFLAGGILAADLHILGQSEGSMQSILYGFCLVFLAAVLSVFSYAIPLLSRYENSFTGTMNNAWRLAAVKIPQTFLLLIIHGLPWVLLLFVPGFFFHFFWIWVFAGGAVGAYLSSVILRPIFAELEG